MTIVADSSAVLAALFDEPGGDRFSRNAGSAKISAVNLAEIGTKLIDKGYTDEEMRVTLLALSANAVPFDAQQAMEASALRGRTRQAGLSLGDRACLALAVGDNATVLTADRAWADLDIACKIEVIR